MKRILATAAIVGLLAACSTAAEDSPSGAPSAQDSTAPDGTGSETSGSETTAPQPPSSDGDPSDDPTTGDAEEQPTSDVDLSQFTIENTSSDDYPELLGQHLPVAARVGGHDGFDRVVVEYDDGNGELTWAAGYENTPVQEGSGNALEIEGEAFLSISVAGIRYPDEGEAASGGLTASGLDQSAIIDDIYVDYGFEGMHSIVVGLDEQRPYRVGLQHDPARIVIDIENDGS